MYCPLCGKPTSLSNISCCFNASTQAHGFIQGNYYLSIVVDNHKITCNRQRHQTIISELTDTGSFVYYKDILIISQSIDFLWADLDSVRKKLKLLLTYA